VFKQATSAGAEVEVPLADMFWGDRYGKLKDPFGHSWSLATHIEDIAPAEMGRRAQEAMSKIGTEVSGRRLEQCVGQNDHYQYVGRGRALTAGSQPALQCFWLAKCGLRGRCRPGARPTTCT
jgi:hypothetical protein